MKSKILIAAIVLAVLGSFAFISIDKNVINKKPVVKLAPVETLSGIVKEDAKF